MAKNGRIRTGSSCEFTLKTVLFGPRKKKLGSTDHSWQQSSHRPAEKRPPTSKGSFTAPLPIRICVVGPPMKPAFGGVAVVSSGGAFMGLIHQSSSSADAYHWRFLSGEPGSQVSAS